MNLASSYLLRISQPEQNHLLSYCTYQVEVFWVVTPCIVVVDYQLFRGPCCLHLYFKVEAAWTSEIHYTASQPRRPRLETSQL
jgi:hypothetical protein